MQHFKFVICIAFAVVNAGRVQKAMYYLEDKVDQKVNPTFDPAKKYYNCEAGFCATMLAPDVVMFRGTIPSSKLFRITNETGGIAYSIYFRTRSYPTMTIKGGNGTKINILANLGFPIRSFMPTWDGITCTRIGGSESQIMSFVGTVQRDNEGYSFVPTGSTIATLRIQFTYDIDYNMIIEYPEPTVITQPFRMRWQSYKDVSSTTGINVRMNEDSHEMKFDGNIGDEMTEFEYHSLYGDDTFKVSFNKI